MIESYKNSLLYDNITSDCSVQIADVNECSENIITTFENNGPEIDHIKAQINIELKPGRRIIVLEKGIEDTAASNSENTVPLVTRSGIINNNLDLKHNLSQTIDDKNEYALKQTLEIFGEQSRSNQHLELLLKLLNMNSQVVGYKHKIEDMKIDIEQKNEQVNRLKQDEKYVKGVLSMLKLSSIKIIPRSILIYIILVSMTFCFFSTSLVIDLFTNINFIHPFISFIFAIASLGLLLTAFVTIKELKKYCLKNIK